MQKFIVTKIDSLPSKAVIQAQDARHIHKVLRLVPGDPIDVTDGTGKDYTATIRSVSPGQIEIDVLDRQEASTESPLDITLCSGMLKDKKMDFVIKHITQLGIYTWIPFFCERSIPHPDARRLKNRIQRWETIAKESLKQCQRSRLPEIIPPLSFNKLLEQSAAHDLKIAFWERATQTLSTLKARTPCHKVIILIGPEGGFSENEIQQAKENGFISCSLGPRILRAETAAISSCTLIQHILGDI